MEYVIVFIIVCILYKFFSSPSQDSAEPTIIVQVKEESNSYSRSIAKLNMSKSELDTIISVDIDDNTDSYSNDDFATFKIYTSNTTTQETSSNKSIGKWITPNETLEINGRQLDKGFIYFGGILDSLNKYHIEPSLIDVNLPCAHLKSISLNNTPYTDDTLGYWPSYSSLSKGCRGAYLDWLASERSAINTPIGYVFIYFYGLERRVINNRDNGDISNNEFIALYNEVLRLNKVYRENQSFYNYSINFLEFMSLIKPSLFKDSILELPNINNLLTFKLELAQTVAMGNLIGANLALSWLKSSFEYSLKTPARRCELEFKTLFYIRYKSKFNDGIKVKPNKTKLKLSYYPASSAINEVELNVADLPDPSVLKGPMNKIIPIAETCTAELNAYSRYLAKSGTSQNDIAALILLPNELINKSNSSVIEKFKNWAGNIIETKEGLTSVAEFWSHIGLVLPKAINKKENKLIINLASKAGFGIAPDFRYHNAKLKPEDKIVLFNYGHGEFFEPSNAFNQIGMALRLGSMVAMIDGRVDIAEKEVLLNVINHDEKLSTTDKHSLSAYLIWRLNTPANMVGLKASLEKLGSNDIEFVRNLIISIALADGKIDVSEIKQIEKLYTFLGLDKSLVTSDIHDLTSLKVTTSSPLMKQAQSNASSFILNEEVLALHENETEHAQSMLSNVFTSDDEFEDSPIVEERAKNEDLDKEHAELYSCLIVKEIWSRDEVFALCKKLNLMIDGAIETINEWAFDNVDEAVVEDEGSIHINFDIVEELKG